MKPDSHVLQPVYSQLGQLLFAEVLARFNGRDTQETILEAEATGSIVQTDLAGLEFGIRAAVPTAVNVSPRTLELAFHEAVKLIRPGLVIEITETHPSSVELLRSFAFEAHARGARISLDDVGSGEFKDLFHVKNVIAATRPRWIKLPMDASDELIKWCKCLNIPLIIERAESSIDLERAIHRIGANGLQGWFFDSQEGKAWLQEVRNKTSIQALDDLALAMA